jgi:hypothetical protein
VSGVYDPLGPAIVIYGPVEVYGPDNCPWHYMDMTETAWVQSGGVGPAYPMSVELLCDDWHVTAMIRRTLGLRPFR